MFKLSKLLHITLLSLALAGFVLQISSTQATQPHATPIPGEPPQAPPSQVEIRPVVSDEDIEARLSGILRATGWYILPEVHVENGVVFLRGQTQAIEHRIWAGDLARNTQGVTAVVNEFEVLEPEYLDFQPFVTVLQDQGRFVLRLIPLLGFSLVILFCTWLIARLTTNLSRRYLRHRKLNSLLQTVISRSIGVLVFLVGLHLIFQLAGLTNVAFTILGGTGLLGLILGIAFRDITENFLASIFLSLQKPFAVGDLIEINDATGFVQRMTTRITVIMTPAGNHVQIPNAEVYRSVIHNFTSNPNRQIVFSVGVGYDASISRAQETILRVLEAHPAVLNNPEHLVLVNELTSATVNLQIYFWIDGAKYSWLKVKSSVIRLVKRALQDAEITMPDEAREIVFPAGLPVSLINVDTESPTPTSPSAPHIEEAVMVVNSAEGGLNSEAEDIEIQGRQSRMPESNENLLIRDDGNASGNR